jgi:hypothetical protein
MTLDHLLYGRYGLGMGFLESPREWGFQQAPISLGCGKKPIEFL